MDCEDDGVRLDKWLWAARFFKTRSLATQAISAGKVQVNGLAAKPSRNVRPGDLLEVRLAQEVRTVRVQLLSAVRGPASVAQGLYQETPQSVQARTQAAAARRQGVEPALTREHGRPTKRDRRSLAQWQRWSVALDPKD